MSASTPTSRTQLRTAMRRARRGLSAQQQQNNAQAVAVKLARSQHILRARTVAAYMASDGELDLSFALTRLLSYGKTVALPVIDRLSGRLAFYEYNSQTRLVRGEFDIPVPPPGARHVPVISIDLMLTPLVAFDDQGNRLGMGGGYYDRTLGPIHPRLRPRLVGVAHELQRSVDPLPHAPWDVPLSAVLTEAGAY